MSNIFAALKRGGTSTADLEPESIHAAPEARPATKPFTPVVHNTQAVMREATPQGICEAAPRAIREMAPQVALRQLPLRLPAHSPLMPFGSGNQRAVEQYQIIRTKILHHARKPQFVLVSSANSGDGKTVTSINIAASLALKADVRVLLIDGDLRQPTVARTLGIAAQPGLTDVLSGQATLEEALIQVAQIPNLYVLAAEQHARAVDLLDSERWRALVGAVRARFTNVVCDAPPIATVADYELLELVADGIILVVRPGHTERGTCHKALASVDQSRMLGVVLNCVEDWWLWKTPEYGYYARARNGSNG